ncbi:MAG: hypothetical protein Q8K99_11295 [Actinomycetota bacterium]|nr:hypothetical protein [Actinomycetota bacterium]
MSFEEKTTWVYAVIAAVVPAVYFTVILERLDHAPIADIAYQRPLLIAIGASIVLSIIGAILMAIGTSIMAEITGSGSIDEIDKKDERDVHINQRGELVGYYVTSAGVVGVLALTMLEYEHFWIANALYLTFAVAAVVSSAVKLVAYRRGF